MYDSISQFADAIDKCRRNRSKPPTFISVVAARDAVVATFSRTTRHVAFGQSTGVVIADTEHFAKFVDSVCSQFRPYHVFNGSTGAARAWQ